MRIKKRGRAKATKRREKGRRYTHNRRRRKRRRRKKKKKKKKVGMKWNALKFDTNQALSNQTRAEAILSKQVVYVTMWQCQGCCCSCRSSISDPHRHISEHMLSRQSSPVGNCPKESNRYKRRVTSLRTLSFCLLWRLTSIAREAVTLDWSLSWRILQHVARFFGHNSAPTSAFSKR